MPKATDLMLNPVSIQSRLMNFGCDHESFEYKSALRLQLTRDFNKL